MESQQNIVDLTINNDDDCLFPTKLGEMVGSLLELDEMIGNKETAKQNDVKQEEESKKIIFKRIW